MRDSGFKALLLSLLARRLRRWADSLSEPEDEPAETRAARSQGKVSSAPAASEPAGESHAASGISSASQKAEPDRADQSLPDRPAGPPEDWISRMSAGPPAHWIERVRQAAPDLLRQEGEGESVMTARVINPTRSEPPPLRLERPMSTPPLQTQSAVDAEPSFTARIFGEFHGESTAGRILASDERREPLAKGGSQVERRRAEDERPRSSFISSRDSQESHAGEETGQAEHRDIGLTPQPK